MIAHSQRVNHRDPVTTSHPPGGEHGYVVKTCTATKGCVRRYKGGTTHDITSFRH